VSSILTHTNTAFNTCLTDLLFHS